MGNTKAPTGDSHTETPKATIRSARKGTNGSKKGQKRHTQRIAVATSGDSDNKEVDDSNKDYVTAAESDFKRHVRQPNDHFEKLLEATFPNHSYLIKHKLKDCTMMKDSMTSGLSPKVRKPEGTWARRARHPFLRRRRS
jgi:hypothetical protein